MRLSPRPERKEKLLLNTHTSHPYNFAYMIFKSVSWMGWSAERIRYEAMTQDKREILTDSFAPSLLYREAFYAEGNLWPLVAHTHTQCFSTESSWLLQLRENSMGLGSASPRQLQSKNSYAGLLTRVSPRFQSRHWAAAAPALQLLLFAYCE